MGQPRARRDRNIDAFLYIGAGVSYVAVAMYEKFLLNWIMGPLWLVAWVSLGPAVVRRLRRQKT